MKYIFALALFLFPVLAEADSNSVIDFKGRLNWVNGSNLASYRIILSDDFTDVSSTTTSTTLAADTTTTTEVPDTTTTTSGPVTTTTCRDDDDGDDHDDDDDHDGHHRAVDEFSLETSSGLPMFDFRCPLEARGRGKFKCSLPGIRVRIKPYKTPGTHTVKVRYTQSIARPAGPTIRVVARSTVFGRAFLDTAWTATTNGFKVRAH